MPLMTKESQESSGQTPSLLFHPIFVQSVTKKQKPSKNHNENPKVLHSGESVLNWIPQEQTVGQ